ncbi:ABC transporter permease [Gynuella sunshinyii]|uniref:Autoinducer 2 import system permease protein LsrC n=1 Tax=Gynuella sunshinyii YC6258 TaxID=1445510 RepID=A0A0C5VQP0_9GAMM|nr:ABC transporter permease [Gynuella sunshinyii]AJQ96581.1 ribose/xylose/arabinose/galactoside ABC-type transport system, permease component [Gynuella sunshinyii YC6258]
MKPLSLIRRRESFLGVVILVLILAVGLITPEFLSAGSLLGAFNDTSILIILALGQMLVIVTRCIDLSVAANVALTGMVVAMLNASYPFIAVPWLLLLAMTLGALLGMINGLLVWRLGVPAIVVTLGTMSIYRGAVFLLSHGAWVNAHQMSAGFIEFPRTTIAWLPVMSWIALTVVLVFFLLTRYWRFGRDFFSAGGNPTAAFYTGIDVGWVQFRAFVISGLLAGLCGYLWVSRYAVAYVDVANGFELQVVAACVIGGVSIMGGIGTVVGCVLGALFLGVINNALPVIGVSPFWQMAISGAVIIVAVIANSRAERRKGRVILRTPTLNMARG